MIIKPISRISIVLFTLLLSSCSTFGFIFERLDWFTIWRLDSMFDLSKAQENQVRPDILELQQWMREDGFPEIINRLENVKERWDNDKPEAAFSYLMASIDDINKRFLDAMKEGVVRFSVQLTEDNARHYREYTNDRQEDWYDSTLSKEAKIDHETERLEEWFGHLNDQQIKLIEKHISLLENERQIRLDNLASWREGYLAAALNSDAQLLRSWLDDLSIFWTDEYRHLRQHNLQQRQSLVFALVPTLTDKQKRHAREHVEDWIEKLRDVLEE
jgi:hypothetical protein